ncbi:hypothetical protein [Pandoraea sp. PE-S2T-3]|uniref:hypothetical protein n=1 Tax=Pandoraea sp. PE-S2T-3 TaxID=1986993 RepID=UPI0020CDB020|nr:hypothetical protein [Pandoraea sp. PE-S2T-3]
MLSLVDPAPVSPSQCIVTVSPTALPWYNGTTTVADGESGSSEPPSASSTEGASSDAALLRLPLVSLSRYMVMLR